MDKIDHAQNLIEEGCRAAQDAYREYKPQIDRYSEDIMAAVREKPIQSLAIAAVAAFALGAILKK